MSITAGEQSNASPLSLTDAARTVLTAADPFEKLRLTQAASNAWHAGTLSTIGVAGAPDRPARPARPELRRSGDMPKRRAGGSIANRVALLHALTHIELNAIDLAWDMIARFADEALPHDFAADWLSVAAEEAKHFGLLAARLAELDAQYGDLPAHDGLWEAAETTRDDLLARLAVVPLVLEARGLDVTPAMIASLTRGGDDASAAVLQTIYEEEIGHVAIGWRWFRHVAAVRGLDADAAWPDLVRRYFRGRLKPPFNDPARLAAGFADPLYASLA